MTNEQINADMSDKHLVYVIHACFRAGPIARWMPPPSAIQRLDRVFVLADHAKRAGYVSSDLSDADATLQLINRGLITTDGQVVMLHPPGLAPRDWPTPENGKTAVEFVPSSTLNFRSPKNV